MINNISGALDAYQQALGRINAGAAKIEGTGASQASSGAGFGDMVKAAVENTVDLNKFSEQMTVQGIQGKADIQDVVLAVSNAETALETVVAVRDTAIKAYNTIMSMPI